MSSREASITDCLALSKAEGRLSPAGMHWLKFHDLLVKRRKSSGGEPPLPLILAAASESDANKHHRLAQQLEWASDNHCLDDALVFLNNLPHETWNIASPEQWCLDNY